MITGIIICLSLLAVVAGMNLLNKTRKNNLGKFYRFVSWFVIVGSFVMILLAIEAGIFQYIMHRINGKEIEEKAFMHERYMHMYDYDNILYHRHNCPCCTKNCSEEMGKCCMQNVKSTGCTQQVEYQSNDEKAENIVKMLTIKLKLSKDQIPQAKDIVIKNLNMKDEVEKNK
ncbi:MAG: hypothetical protein Q8880_05160 [Bacteroidota bacterium]|nr:hypothetical protein [Bacteroidota bacterium]